MPKRENRCQGRALQFQYGARGIVNGTAFIVVISHPDLIADRPFVGVDIAKVKDDCG